MPFLPITLKEMQDYGFSQPDFIIVTGDAYVDHPSFGTAVISRVLQNEGFNVCIIPQPKNDSDYTLFGKPRLAFLVNSGNIDSMVAHYNSANYTVMYLLPLAELRLPFADSPTMTIGTIKFAPLFFWILPQTCLCTVWVKNTLPKLLTD